MTDKDMIRCHNCGKLTHIDNLDGKPPSLAGKRCTDADIAAAADSGAEDFTILECEACYGPAWRPMAGE